MKNLSAQLVTLLNSRQFLYANLFNFTLVDSTNLYYSGGDLDIAYNGNIYSCGGNTGPYFDSANNKAKYHCKRGLEVDTLVFDGIPDSSSIEGLPFVKAIQQGVFDGAELTLHRAYWSTIGYQTSPMVPVGVVDSIFVGRIADIDASRSVSTFNVNSHLELLNQNLPRDIYQSGCMNTLYDSSCALSQSAFSQSGTATAASGMQAINTTLSQASGYFDQGKIKFTSGANAGIWRTIKSYVNGSPGTLSFTSPFPNVPAAGDSFTAYPGCDKQQATCQNKFSNLANFRGFPYIPNNTTAV